MKHVLEIKQNELEQGLESIRQYLLEAKVSKSEITRNLLVIEDILVCMLNRSHGDSIKVILRSDLGNVNLHLKAAGEAFSMDDVQKEYYEILEDDPEINAVLQRFLGKFSEKNYEITHRYGVNHCKIHISRSKYTNLIRILTALVLGLACGCLMKAILPLSAAELISKNIFASVSTMFINALKMIVAPLVFFSMASSIADFSDLRALGKIAAKTVGAYLIASFIACVIGLGTYSLFPIGDPSLASLVTDQASAMVETGTQTSVSLLNMVVNIIPSDFISPFFHSEMLQIIFMGIMIGIAISALNDRYPFAKQAVNCMNDIFGKITAIIISFMPIAIFCSMAKMIIGIDFASFTKILTWIPVCYFGDLCMMIVFCLVLIVTGLNPIKFLRGYYSAMLTAYSMGSSNAAMPASLKACPEKLGISKTITSFCIPLGSTINMNGSCIYLIISTLFMSKIFGVTFNLSMLITLVVSVIVLSMGAPGVPGSGLICLSIVLPQFGMPAEGISIIMGLYTIAGMALACTNVTGDAIVALLVAKSEKQLDYDVFNAN